jgi:hypothetical protein
VTYDVPQGSILMPQLFHILRNDVSIAIGTVFSVLDFTEVAISYVSSGFQTFKLASRG